MVILIDFFFSLFQNEVGIKVSQISALLAVIFFNTRRVEFFILFLFEIARIIMRVLLNYGTRMIFIYRVRGTNVLHTPVLCVSLQLGSVTDPLL